VLVPVVNVLWNSGVFWPPATLVTATVKVVLAARFCDGAKVSDRPSFDKVTLPVMPVLP